MEVVQVIIRRHLIEDVAQIPGERVRHSDGVVRLVQEFAEGVLVPRDTAHRMEEGVEQVACGDFSDGQRWCGDLSVGHATGMHE